MNTRRVIWSNIHLDYEDWRADLEADYPDLTEDERYHRMQEINDDYLDDERANLDIRLSQPILLIADIGRWNGRFSGYAVIRSGRISDCLHTEMELAEWYVDRLGDFRADAVHHDGTNHYLYRVFRDSATDPQRARLMDKIYEGTASRADITRVTRRLGDEIARVYGFRIPRMKTSITA